MSDLIIMVMKMCRNRSEDFKIETSKGEAKIYFKDAVWDLSCYSDLNQGLLEMMFFIMDKNSSEEKK